MCREKRRLSLGWSAACHDLRYCPPMSFKYWTWAQPVLLLGATFTALKEKLFGYITLTF